MPLGMTKIISKIQDHIDAVDSSTTESDQMLLAGSDKFLENLNAALVYPTTSDFPAASTNKGRLVYARSTSRYYYSDGTSWKGIWEIDSPVPVQDTLFFTGQYASSWGADSVFPGFSITSSQNTFVPYARTGYSENYGVASKLYGSSKIHRIFVINTSGRAYAWGANQYGQLGINSAGASISTPTELAGGSTNWTKIATENDYETTGYYGSNSGLKSDGTLWSWGWGSGGQLGTNNTICYSSPVQEASGNTAWTDTARHYQGGIAIKSDGTLWGWGTNSFGQLGTNDTDEYSSPVQEVSSSTDWSSCATKKGGKYTQAAIKTDGTLWSWGYNGFGQLGTNNTISYSSPVQEVSSSTNWSSFDIAEEHVVAIKSDGTLWAWGEGQYGRLGTNITTRCSSPVQEASSSTNWSKVFVGDKHTIAIKTDGTLWAWGYNIRGQLGTNNTTCYQSPVQEASSSTSWEDAACSQNATIGIKEYGFTAL